LDISLDVKQGDAHLNALVSGKPRTLISGEYGALDRACLLNEANSPLCGAIPSTNKCTMLTKINIFQDFFPGGIELSTVVKSTTLSISHTAEIVIYLELQNWHSKPYNLSR